MAMVEQTRKMHGITFPEQQQDVKLGLTPTTEVNFEGMNVKSLVGYRVTCYNCFCKVSLSNLS